MTPTVRSALLPLWLLGCGAQPSATLELPSTVETVILSVTDADTRRVTVHEAGPDSRVELEIESTAGAVLWGFEAGPEALGLEPGPLVSVDGECSVRPTGVWGLAEGATWRVVDEPAPRLDRSEDGCCPLDEACARCEDIEVTRSLSLGRVMSPSFLGLVDPERALLLTTGSEGVGSAYRLDVPTEAVTELGEIEPFQVSFARGRVVYLVTPEGALRRLDLDALAGLGVDAAALGAALEPIQTKGHLPLVPTLEGAPEGAPFELFALDSQDGVWHLDEALAWRQIHPHDVGRASRHNRGIWLEPGRLLYQDSSEQSFVIDRDGARTVVPSDWRDDQRGGGVDRLARTEAGIFAVGAQETAGAQILLFEDGRLKHHADFPNPRSELHGFGIIEGRLRLFVAPVDVIDYQPESRTFCPPRSLPFSHQLFRTTIRAGARDILVSRAFGSGTGMGSLVAFARH